MFHPVREIKPTRRSVSGVYPFRKQYSLAYESSLERDFIVLQEFDSSVIEVIAQPIKIPFSLKGRNYQYTPDFLVMFEQVYPTRGMLVEVKPESEWRNHWRSWLPKWKAAYRWAVERDFLFHIYDESRIRGQRLANIKTLSRFLDKQSDDALAGLIADFVGDGMVSMGDILSYFSTFPACGSEVYRMLASRGLFCDLEDPLSADTLIWRKND